MLIAIILQKCQGMNVKEGDSKKEKIKRRVKVMNSFSRKSFCLQLLPCHEFLFRLLLWFLFKLFFFLTCKMRSPSISLMLLQILSRSFPRIAVHHKSNMTRRKKHEIEIMGKKWLNERSKEDCMMSEKREDREEGSVWIKGNERGSHHHRPVCFCGWKILSVYLSRCQTLFLLM